MEHKEPTGRPTLEMIAKAAGVSKMSVSRCLRGHPNNSKKTQERVRKIAFDLGYRPNPMISALMSDIRSRKQQDQSTVIAVLDDFEGERPEVLGSSWDEHLEGIRSQTVKLGYKLDVFRYRELQLDESRLSRILWARNIRGLIIPHQFRLIDLMAMDLSALACVTLGYTLIKPQMHKVCPDFSHGMQTALKHLKELGYTRPAFISQENNLIRTKQLYLSAYLADRFMSGDRERVLILERDKVTETGRLGKWMKKEKPDCVVSTINEVSDSLVKLGYHIPEDIGFVQLNWTPCWEGTAGVKNRNRLQGIEAVKLVNAAILSNEFGLPREPVVHLVRNEWVPGGSVRQQS